jgi:hypothetical protein
MNMIRARRILRKAFERKVLQQRVDRMYDYFNKEAWKKCFSLLDPRLRKQQRVDQQVYTEGLRNFRAVYGGVQPWYIRLSLHLDGSINKHDPRPFAYVYVVWQDQNHEFHMFRERWVRDSGRWFSRVVGLVPNKTNSESTQV